MVEKIIFFTIIGICLLGVLAIFISTGYQMHKHMQEAERYHQMQRKRQEERLRQELKEFEEFKEQKRLKELARYREMSEK